MNINLLSDDEYAELLKSREKPLTKGQIRELRKIDQIQILLSQYPEISDEMKNSVFQSLRRRQMEVLTSERKEPGEKLSDILPDTVVNKISVLDG